MASNYWRFIYAFPVYTNISSLVLSLLVHKEDSLMLSVQNGDDENSKSVISKIYVDEDKLTQDLILAEMKN